MHRKILELLVRHSKRLAKPNSNGIVYVWDLVTNKISRIWEGIRH